jgi:cell division protein FtsL
VSPKSRKSKGARRAPRGRAIVAVALMAFVLMAAAVVWRRSYGIARTRELQVLESRRRQLVAERASLQSAVRLAASRARIGDAAEQRLGMRVPSDTQVVILTRPDARPARGGAPAPGDSTP